MQKNNTVSEEQIVEMLENASIEATTQFGKTTIVAIKLENGFVITESASCVDPNNYDLEVGYNICMNNIKNKLWELEGYKFQDKLHKDSIERALFGDDD